MGNLMEPWQLQPARDTGLTPSERFRSVRRESGLLESLAHHFCFSLLRIYFSIAHRLTIMGRENLPAHGPFVVVANHCSHLDALALGAALPPRHRERAFPIAAGDVFFQTNVTSTFSAIILNALPMWRKNCGPHACRFAPEITGRKIHLHHLPGRWTQSRRLDEAIQTRTWDARRGNKRAGRTLRSCWSFRGSAARSEDSATWGNPASDRRCARVCINSQRSHRLVANRGPR
jgi:Acyltransferase